MFGKKITILNGESIVYLSGCIEKLTHEVAIASGAEELVGGQLLYKTDKDGIDGFILSTACTGIMNEIAKVNLLNEQDFYAIVIFMLARAYTSAEGTIPDYESGINFAGAKKTYQEKFQPLFGQAAERQQSIAPPGVDPGSN